MLECRHGRLECTCSESKRINFQHNNNHPESEQWAKLLIDPMFGVNVVLACATCAALIPDTPIHKAMHLEWHNRD